MSEGFAKIYTSMLRSSVWVGKPKDVKILWVTMLTLADMHGYVGASILGLAKEAELTIDETAAALEVLKAPDPYSRSKDEEGRRVREVDGGWHVINHRKWRELRTHKQIAGAARQAAYNARRKGKQTDEPRPLAEHTDGVTGRKPRVRNVSGVSVSASDDQKQRQKQRQKQKQTGLEGSSDPKDASSTEHPPPPLPEPPSQPEDPGTVVPIGRRSHTVPPDWMPKERHRMRCIELGLDLGEQVELFRKTEFQQAYSEWDLRFDKWLIRARQYAETDNHQRRQRAGGELQPNHGRTGFEGVNWEPLDDDPEDDGGE